MGLKAREVTARHTVSLEDLVPADDFYRHLDRVLDLAFVRDLVRDTYAPAGRPSIDPVVFFRLQLVLFFEGLRSERQLLRVVADRLSLRWYLGYDLGERAARPLQPDPHPRPLRPGGLPPLLRGHRGALPGGGAGLGQGALPRRDQGGGQRGAALAAPALLRRGPPAAALPGRRHPSGGSHDGAGGARPGQRWSRGAHGPAHGRPGGAGRGERPAPRLARRGRAAGPAAHGGPGPAALRAAGRPGGEHDRPGRDARWTPRAGCAWATRPTTSSTAGRPASSSPSWSPRPRCGTTSRRRTCSGTPASAGACAPAR